MTQNDTTETHETLFKKSVSFHHDKTLVFTSGRVLQRRYYVCWWTNVSICKIYREQNAEHLLRLKILYLKEKHIPHKNAYECEVTTLATYLTSKLSEELVLRSMDKGSAQLMLTVSSLLTTTCMRIWIGGAISVLMSTVTEPECGSSFGKGKILREHHSPLTIQDLTIQLHWRLKSLT